MSNLSQNPDVSVIIPTLDAPDQSLISLTETVLDSGLDPGTTEVIAAVGIRPNGRARNVGAAHARGDLLIFMDDDVRFPDPEDLKRLVEFLRATPEAGLVGPAQQLPPELDERTRSRAHQLPRSHVETVDTFTETDMVTHACLAIRRDDFFEVGMEHPNLISGTDPDLRHRIRKLGKQVGLVPGTRVYHPPAGRWSELIRQNYAGGRRSRAVQREYPDYHLSAEPDLTDVETTQKSTTLKRGLNHLNRFIDGVINGHTWWLAAQVSYLVGFLHECLLPRSWVDPMPYPDPPSPDHPDWDRFIAELQSRGTVRWLHPECR